MAGDVFRDGRKRYPSDLTDEQWALIADLIPPQRRTRRGGWGADRLSIGNRVHSPSGMTGAISVDLSTGATPAIMASWPVEFHNRPSHASVRDALRD